jgi:hypothetical protein
MFDTVSWRRIVFFAKNTILLINFTDFGRTFFGFHTAPLRCSAVWILYASFAVITLVGVDVLAFLPAAKKPPPKLATTSKWRRAQVGTFGLSADEKLASKGDSNLVQIVEPFPAEQSKTNF